MNIEVISASAGTGKTWRLTEELGTALVNETARPEGVVAITYTTKAAAELESRIREKLLSAGRADLAERVRDGYLGTIHAVCQRLLREFALEAGLSPFLEPIPDAERKQLFDVALAGVLAGREPGLNELARRLALEDWKAELRTIVDKARENGMDAAALALSAARSRERMLAFFPKQTLSRDEFRTRLLSALQPLVPALEAEGAEGETAEKRVALARRVRADAHRFGLPAWKDLVDLSGLLRVKKLAPVAGSFNALVDEHPSCAAFQEDLLAMQAELFDLAAKALGAFADRRAVARVVDFGDMLARAHELLGLPEVRDVLASRLDLVLVDEFQDTSPIQLAVAAALAAVARRSIWVGDRKQAIFGFQGSDPELMAAAMDSALQGRPPHILKESFRSRPAIVDLVSELFSKALLPHGFPEEQVRLTARHKDPDPLASQPAFACWRFTPRKTERDGVEIRSREPHAVAEGVESLLAQPPLVRQRSADASVQLRRAEAGDIAVLAHTNDQCRAIAAALLARGIAARVSLEGLARTPEALFAAAALALLADPSDGVAALEIGYLGGAAAADPDGWLARRFIEVAEWRRQREAAEAEGRDRPEQPLFAHDARVTALREAAKLSVRLSPAEALDEALRVAGVVDVLRGWPDPEQRLANIEALRAEARAYEDLCSARHSAATALGLVDHLRRLDEKAPQATPTATDAVTVSTWHKAKGLEWPVVVLASLDHQKDRSVFEIAVEPAAAFDFAQPLADRWVRYWPWPYGRKSTGLALLDAANRSPEALRAAERELRERARLLYVAFTRPRDLLVALAASDAKKGVLLSALEPLRDKAGTLLVEFPFLAAPGQAQVRAGAAAWPCTVAELSGFPPQAAARPRRAVQWYAPGTRSARPPEIVNPSREPLPVTATLLSVSKLGARKKLAAGSGEMDRVGDAIHAFLAADCIEDAEARRRMAEGLLRAHGVAHALTPETLLDISDALRTWLDERHPGAKWRREWPVRAHLDGPAPRLLEGEVDLYLELEDGFVLVDHKSFPGAEAERDKRVPEWGTQLGWYADTLAKALKKPLLAAYIHLPVRGEMAQLQLDQQDVEKGRTCRRRAS